MKKVISILILFLFSITSTFAGYGIYYGTAKLYAGKTFNAFDLMIIQPYNFDLYKNYTGKKICYLSVGEFDGTDSDLLNLGLQEAKVGVNTDWNSIIMDMGNQKWQDYLVKKEIELKNIGCNGLFLDTIWNDNQKLGAIEIVKKLRSNWNNAYLIPNNAHNIKNDINAYVDSYMFENFWDYGTKIGSEDEKWYLELSKQYQELIKTGKKVYALSYGDPYANTLRQKWGNKVLSLSNTYGFDLVFSNLNLTKIFAYKKDNKLIKFE